MRMRRRRGLAGRWIIAGAAVLVLAGVVLWRHVPRAPPPAAWNLLAKALIADEFDRDTRWNPVLMNQASAPRTPDQVAARLQASADALEGRWFKGGWNGLAPGELPALKTAAEAYAQAYRAAHATPQIAGAFDGRGLPIIETVGGPTDSAASLAALTQLQRDLQAASAPWSARAPHGPGLDQADRLRAILSARERLAGSEAGLLQLVLDHPGAPAPAAGPEGASRLAEVGPGCQALAQSLLDRRTRAAADLQQAERSLGANRAGG